MSDKRRSGGPRGEKPTALKRRGPFYVCARETCRRRFRAPYNPHGGYNVLSGSGLCPRCRRLIEGKNARALDPKLYALCQKIDAEERAKWTNPSGFKVRSRTIARRERALLTKLSRRPLPMVPTAAEALLSDGYAPTANSGKRGGPNTKGGD